MAQWSVVGKGGAACASVSLRRGQKIKAEPDALITMSEHVELTADMDAGLVSGLMRSALGGESFFSQVLTALADGQDVILGAPDIGDVETIRLTHDSPILLQKGAFLAADAAVQISTATQRNGVGALFSGAGLFVLRAQGQGVLAVNAHGSILKFDLHAGETRAVDNGHLVGWSESMHYEMRMAASGGGNRGRSLLSSVYASAASGEGLMCFFRGPGTLWIQTHKPPPPDEGDGKGGGGGSKRARGGRGGGGLLGLLFGSCAGCCVLLLIIAALASIFLVVPAYGGHWVRKGDGAWTIKWDQAPQGRPSAGSTTGSLGGEGTSSRAARRRSTGAAAGSGGGSYHEDERYEPPYEARSSGSSGGGRTRRYEDEL